MHLPYRVTRENALDLDINNITKQGEVLVRSRDEASQLISESEKRLAGKLPRHIRAELLNKRAICYQALGDPFMLEAAQESYSFSKTAIPAFVLALSYHFHGQMDEAFKYYVRAHELPHGFAASLEIEFGYVTQFLFKNQWDRAWPILEKLGKRIVDVLRRQNGGVLPEWRPDSTAREISIIQEGGYGDIIQYSRYLEWIRDRGIKATVYMTPSFFESGFVDLFRRQDFGVEFKTAKEIPANIPAIGFLDFNFAFRITPEAVPQYRKPWQASSESEQWRKYQYVRRPENKKVIGLCWHAREKENIFSAPGTYRSLTAEHAQKLIRETSDKVFWVNLQHGEETPNIDNPKFKTWDDTASLLASCDEVVSVDTAVGHLAAAVNKPTHILLSGFLEWKYGMEGSCLWYPSAKLYRNRAFGFDHAIENLIKEINTNAS